MLTEALLVGMKMSAQTDNNLRQPLIAFCILNTLLFC